MTQRSGARRGDGPCGGRRFDEGYEPRQGYWRALGPVAGAALATVADRATYPDGGTLLTRQDRSRDVLVIWSGLAKAVARLPGPSHVVLALRGPGDVLGELADLNGGVRSADVLAVGPVQALVIRQADFARFLRAFPQAADTLHRTVADRLREADRDRLAAASMSVGQRLARFLLKVTYRYGEPTANGVTINQFSQKELAACVGGAHRTVAREMGGWREREIISTSRRSVTIHEPDALERIAGRFAPPP